MGGQCGDGLLQSFQRNGADAEPRGRVGRQRGVHDGTQIALAPADEHGVRGRPIGQGFRRQPLGKVQILHGKFCAVLANQLTRIGVTFSGINAALGRSQRHFHTDTAGARTHIPQGIVRAHGQLCQHGGADLLLGHRRFAAEKHFIRQAGGAARRRGAALRQQHAQRRELLLRQRGHCVGHKALGIAAEVFPHGRYDLAVPGCCQPGAECRGRLTAACQEERWHALLARSYRIAGAAVGRYELPILPGAAQCRRQ